MERINSGQLQSVIDYITKCIVEGYNYTQQEAFNMIEGYELKRKIRNDEEFFFHYNLEHWAGKIVEWSKK